MFIYVYHRVTNRGRINIVNMQMNPSLERSDRAKRVEFYHFVARVHSQLNVFQGFLFEYIFQDVPLNTENLCWQSDFRSQKRLKNALSFSSLNLKFELLQLNPTQILHAAHFLVAFIIYFFFNTSS